MAFDKDRKTHEGITPYSDTEENEADEGDFRFYVENPSNLFKKHSTAFIKITNLETEESEVFEFSLIGFSAAYKHFISRNG